MEELLQKLENLIGTDDFEYKSEEIMEKLEEAGAGAEIIETLLGMMERHPLDDFGMPGAVVHFIERFYPDFLPLLIASVKRAPALHTVWMVNRCIRTGKQRDELLAALESAAANESADKAVRASAQSFLEG